MIGAAPVTECTLEHFLLKCGKTRNEIALQQGKIVNTYLSLKHLLKDIKISKWFFFKDMECPKALLSHF